MDILYLVGSLFVVFFGVVAAVLATRDRAAILFWMVISSLMFTLSIILISAKIASYQIGLAS